MKLIFGLLNMGLHNNVKHNHFQGQLPNRCLTVGSVVSFMTSLYVLRSVLTHTYQSCPEDWCTPSNLWNCPIQCTPAPQWTECFSAQRTPSTMAPSLQRSFGLRSDGEYLSRWSEGWTFCCLSRGEWVGPQLRECWSRVTGMGGGGGKVLWWWLPWR